MRRLVVALVAALVLLAVALSLTACGGDSSSSSGTTDAAAPAAATAPPPPTAPAPAASGSDNAANTLSPQLEGTGTPFPSGQTAPGVVRTRLEQKSPMVVFFYDPKQLTTRDVRRELDSALKGYRGLISLVELDASAAMGEGAVANPTHPTVAQQTSMLSETLGVDFTPYLVFVDRQGMITARFRGFVERGLLEREIIRATQ